MIATMYRTGMRLLTVPAMLCCQALTWMILRTRSYLTDCTGVGSVVLVRLRSWQLRRHWVLRLLTRSITLGCRDGGMSTRRLPRLLMPTRSIYGTTIIGTGNLLRL